MASRFWSTVRGAAIVVGMALPLGLAATAAEASSTPGPAVSRGSGEGVPSTFSFYKGTFAGYVTPTGAVHSASGRVKVPAVTCPSSGGAALDESIQIYSPSDEGAEMFVEESCYKGAATYYGTTAITTAGGDVTYKNVPFKISPGNVISTHATVSARGVLKVTTENMTTKKSSSQSGKTKAGAKYYGLAYDQNELPTLPIPKFKGLSWTSVKVDGKPIAKTHPKAYDMVNKANHHLLIKTSKLSSSGTSFINTFVATH
jgi:hypothetical protein